MKLKRVLLVSHEMTFTGAPNSLLNVAVLLRRHRHRVTVVTLKSGEFEKEYGKHGFKVTCINEGDYDYKELCGKYDLVIANTIFCGKFALNSQKYVPTALYIREAHNLPEIIEKCGLSEKYITDSEDIICVSEYAEEFIKANYPVKNLSVLHNFLNKRLLFRPRANVAEEGKVHFLIAATIERRKGIDFALKAFEILPKDISEKAVLHIAGRKPSWSAEYHSRLNLKGHNIIYHGEISNRSDMDRLYSRMNVVVVPSLDESCSLTALEGAMHGKALILSENVGAKYLIDNNGFVVETGSAKKLSEAVSWITSNQDMLKDMGNASYRSFLKYATAKEYYKRFSEIYFK